MEVEVEAKVKIMMEVSWASDRISRLLHPVVQGRTEQGSRWGGSRSRSWQ